jgi:hypothetical protein
MVGHELAAITTDDVRDDYERVRGVLQASRGGGDDRVTAGLLAGARKNRSLAELKEWGRQTGVAAPAEFEARARDLADAGVLSLDGERLSVAGRLSAADADAEQLTTAALSVGGWQS